MLHYSLCTATLRYEHIQCPIDVRMVELLIKLASFLCPVRLFRLDILGGQYAVGTGLIPHKVDVASQRFYIPVVFVLS